MTILFQLRSCVFMLTTCSMLVLVSGCTKPAEPVRTGTAGTTIGTEANDTVITGKVKEALLTDESIKSVPIKVKTEKGEVVLSGFVDNPAQAAHAVDVAQGIEGVESVLNHMVVKGT